MNEIANHFPVEEWGSKFVAVNYESQVYYQEGRGGVEAK